MATVKVTPRSLTDAYKRREGDFSPNLVGLQFTDGVSLFTFGNFQITANLDNKLNKNFVLGGQWSDYYNLDNLNLSESTSNIILSNDIFVRLNFNPYNISRYVYFGSFQEFTRVTLEQIIQKWKGSVYLNSNFNTNTVVNTVLSFNYDTGNDISTFLIPKNVITNNFQLIVDDNFNFYDIPEGEIYNLQRDYTKYVVWAYGDKEFPLIGYTGSTDSYQYIRVKTKGNPFPSLTGSTFGQINYHVKPDSLEVQLFFENLTDFEKVILNRLTTPIYTSYFDVPKESDGVIYSTTESFTWPVSDGYNLDINTRDYASFVEKLLSAAINFDTYKTDLTSRRFVSESIHEFDTNGGTATASGDNTYGMKASKLLRIYGREFDEVKKYIDGISFANVVTYDKLDNTSDELIKMMAKNLGFDVLLTVGTDNFNLLEQIKPSLHSPFSGYSRALSSKELDIELWRRLVINAWWLFKSKGTRKVIEFFFSLFKIPECMVSLNEYIYLAENRLDPIKVWEQISEIYGDPDLIPLSDLPMDDYGFPRTLTKTDTNYFQMNGFWYNGGTDITTGNNPHIGPYDFGKSYFNQFECFVPDFNNFLTASTLVTVTKNYFNNYNEGTFIFDQNGLPVPYYGTGYANILNNNNLVDNVVVNSAGLTYVGGNNAPKYGRPSGDTYSMKVSFTAGNKTVCDPCSIYQLTFGPDGIVYVTGNPNTPLTNQLCCKSYWLPITVNPPVCPNVADLMISINNEVLDSNTGLSVSQACCSKAILGFDVAWDGKNCVIPQTCPDPVNLQITIGGVVLDSSTNQSVTQQCCTKSALGFDVIWNGKECEQVTLVKTDTAIAFGIRNVTVARQYSVDNLFKSAIGVAEPVTPVTPTNYACYWCPPESYTQTICSVDDYLATSTDTQIISFAIKLGAPSNVTLNDAIIFISNIYKPFFETYGCIILDNQDKIIKDNACCTLRGGILTNIEGVNYCIKSSPNPCVGSQISPSTHVWVTPSSTLLPESCCNQNGQYWVSPLINGDNIILVTANGSSTFLDIPGSTFAGQTSYCSACPKNLVEVNNIIQDNNNNDLSQQCCLDYGFNWDSSSKIAKCTKCPTVVNYGTPSNNTLITNLNGSDLSQQCCDLVSGWYGNIGDGNKCYSCPGITIPDGTGTLIPNPNYTLSLQSNDIDYEILYNGGSLTKECCDLWALNDNGGAVVWDATSNKCLTR